MTSRSSSATAASQAMLRRMCIRRSGCDEAEVCVQTDADAAFRRTAHAAADVCSSAPIHTHASGGQLTTNSESYWRIQDKCAVQRRPAAGADAEARERPGFANRSGFANRHGAGMNPCDARARAIRRPPRRRAAGASIRIIPGRSPLTGMSAPQRTRCRQEIDP